MGFVYSMDPVLERLYPDTRDRQEATRRHLDGVNTHPLMGPMLVGVSARLEQEKGGTAVRSYRVPVMTALAAQGDRIFWGHVRPLAAIAGVMGCLCFRDSLVGSLVFLLVYNAPHLLVRGRGFASGWQKGMGVLAVFRSPLVERLISMTGRAVALGLGVVTGALVLKASATGWKLEPSSVDLITLGTIGISGGIGSWLVWKGLAVELAIYALVLVTLMLLIWL